MIDHVIVGRGLRRPRALGWTTAAVMLLNAAAAAAAAANVVHVGYVSGVEPAKAGIVKDGFEGDSALTVEWRRFDNGAEIVRALAGGDLDIGNVGSSVVAVAAGRELPITTFLIASELGTSEALVARTGSGIHSPADLAGKTIAVPFVTTAHYSLLAALKHWGLERNAVHVINLRISEIPAAWQNGNIDAAYAWDPALGRIKETGTVLATSADVARWGAPTFDVWVVRRDFAARDPHAVESFARDALDLMQAYGSDPAGFAKDPRKLARIVDATGAKVADVPQLLPGNRYPLVAEQQRLLTGPYVQALAATGAFLKEQGKIDAVLADYKSYATTVYLPSAGR